MQKIELVKEVFTTQRKTYSASAPDTSLMTVVIENETVRVICGGSELSVPTNCLAPLAELIAEVARQTPVSATVDAVPASVSSDAQAPIATAAL